MEKNKIELLKDILNDSYIDSSYEGPLVHIYNKMKKSILHELIKEELLYVLQENAKVDPTVEHAKSFIVDTLKLNSKQNLFDSFMKKNNIKESELSTFVELVVKEITKSYL